MSSIRSFGQSFAAKLNHAADSAQEKAKSIQSKASQQLHSLGGLANRTPASGTGSAAPRQSLLEKMSDLKQSAIGLKQEVKQSAAVLKQEIKDTASEARANLKDLKQSAIGLKQEIKEEIKYTASEAKASLKDLKQSATELKKDMKEFRHYLRHGDENDDSKAALQALLPDLSGIGKAFSDAKAKLNELKQSTTEPKA